MIIVVKADPLFAQYGDRAWKHAKANLNLVCDFINSLPRGRAAYLVSMIVVQRCYLVFGTETDSDSIRGASNNGTLKLYSNFFLLAQ